MRKIFPLLMGVVGVAILIGLCVWQVQRLQWKTAILAEIDARIVAAPVALPAAPDPEVDTFLPVTVIGRTVGTPIFVLTSAKDLGAGYRLISAFETDGRRIMVDLGFVPLEALQNPPAPMDMTVTGNVHWPQEVDSWTPEPDPSGIWFARDVAPMATALETEPVLVIARAVEAANATFIPLPIDSTNVPNDHLGYAITWALLAVAWAIMSGFLVFRQRRPKDV